LGIGDWGLGIGDWANPQSPIPNPHFFSIINQFKIIYEIIFLRPIIKKYFENKNNFITKIY
jgi:hypothetical protein